MKITKKNKVNIPSSRRAVLKSVALSGAALSVLPSTWTKPVVNSVLLPAHAQTSVCASVIFGNATSSVGSGGAVCGLSFELLSGDAAASIDIISITNTAPVSPDAVTYPSGTSGSVTATSGLSVNWVGAAIGAPFTCSPLDAINEITFTVTYNCASDPTVQTATFSLQAIGMTV